MKKKDLEMFLQKVPDFDKPVASLEQYNTPSIIASDVLFTAYANGDVADMDIADLGCGPGTFSFGCWKLGASKVTGYDISGNALEQARGFAAIYNADIEFIESDVSNVSCKVDTVFMNPPFGCQSRGADRPFLSKALEIADCVYSIHMADTLDFVEEYADKLGRSLEWHKTYRYDINHRFDFHKKKKETVEIVAVCLR